MTQMSLTLLIWQMRQSLNLFHGPSLDSLQFVHVFLVSTAALSCESYPITYPWSQWVHSTVTSHRHQSPPVCSPLGISVYHFREVPCCADLPEKVWISPHHAGPLSSSLFVYIHMGWAPHFFWLQDLPCPCQPTHSACQNNLHCLSTFSLPRRM